MKTQTGHGDHVTRNRGAIRFLCLALGIPQLFVGLQAVLTPKGFYEDFPFGTDGWVHVLGPYNEHFVNDVGALFVGLAALMIYAGISLRRGTLLIAGVTWLCYALPHTVWHIANLDPYEGFDLVANVVTLPAQVAGGALLLFLLRAPKAGPAAERRPSGPANMRIRGVEDGEGGLVARSTYWYARRDLGKVPTPMRAYAHHPMLLQGYGALELATEKADRVPERFKLLAATKTAAVVGCEFCMDIASMLSTKSGVTEAQLRALPDHANSDEFDEVEKLVLDYAVAMTRTPAEIPDELFAELAEHFDEAQLVELTHEIAIENYRARFNWAFGIGSDGFADGAFCVRAATVPA